MKDEKAARLKQARKGAGFRRATDAAASLGVPYQTYAAHENGSRTYDTDAAAVYARRFRVTTDWLLTGRDRGRPASVVPIVGKAGAGPDGSVLFSEGDGNFGDIPAPPNSSPETVALEVQGDSMTGIARDGWIVTYDEPGPPREEHLGEPCVCWLEDGRVLIKTPFAGRGAGLFDLESENARTMRDVPVRMFALITNIVPRKSAQRLVQRNPDMEMQDLAIAARRTA